MAQYIYTMNRVSKMVPPKREILKDISLSFFPGAKIGVLGLNGAGKSTLLRIMAGVDKDFSGEARAQPGIKIGYLEQEPPLDPNKDVRGNVEDGVREALDALERLDQVFAEYADPDADFDKLAKEQEKLEAIIQTWDAHNLDNQLEIAANALNLPHGMPMSLCFLVVSAAVLHCAVCCCRSQTCCFLTNQPTIWMPNRCLG